jgi:hypothetical protein
MLPDNLHRPCKKVAFSQGVKVDIAVQTIGCPLKPDNAIGAPGTGLLQERMMESSGYPKGTRLIANKVIRSFNGSSYPEAIGNLVPFNFSHLIPVQVMLFFCPNKKRPVAKVFMHATPRKCRVSVARSPVKNNAVFC